MTTENIIDELSAQDALDAEELFSGGKKEPILPEEGIYFDMSEADYHACRYFSRSFAEEVMCDLEEAEYRLTNPITKTDAMELGTAIHAAFLEPEKFEETYSVYPSSENYKGKTILKTAEDLKAVLKNVGEKISGAKEELIARAKPWIDPQKFVIWDEEVSNFHEKVRLEGKLVLYPQDLETINGLRASFNKRTQIKEILADGRSEVTLIWKDEQTGVMCKCRLDRVRPEAIGEVKSFSLKYKKPLFDYLFKEIINNRYNFQFAIYQEALETVIKKVRSNQAKVYGEVDPTWLKKFLEFSHKQFFILFVRTAAPYQMKAIEMQRAARKGGTNNEYFNIAHQNWRRAITKFANAKKTGVWMEREVEILDDIHVPSVVYQSPIY